MTQVPNEHRNGAGQMTWLWMVIAVVAVGAFMYWLGATSEPSTPQVVEADKPALDATGVATVALDELANGLASYAGMDVRLEAIPVASRLGAQAFWTTTSSGVPFLVRLAPSLVADSFTVEGGESVSVVGRVMAMSDSVLAAWQDEGVLADDNQRMEAEFATGFLEATQAVKLPAAQEEDAEAASPE